MPAAGAIRAARAYVELFADDSKLVRGLRRAQAKLKAFGRSVQQFGRQLLTVGSLAAVPFALSAQTFANFESQMARVKALTGATGEQFTRLEQEPAGITKSSGSDAHPTLQQNFRFLVNLLMQMCVSNHNPLAMASINHSNAALEPALPGGLLKSFHSLNPIPASQLLSRRENLQCLSYGQVS